MATDAESRALDETNGCSRLAITTVSLSTIPDGDTMTEEVVDDRQNAGR
jgi:hypothetical protein